MQKQHEVQVGGKVEHENVKLTELVKAPRELSHEKRNMTENLSVADSKARQLIDGRKEISFKGGIGYYEMEVKRGNGLISEGERLRSIGKWAKGDEKIREGRRIVADAERKKQYALDRERERERREKERRDRERRNRR